MNIITNNCLGGFIYRDILKTEYQNPFIWTAINHLDLLSIIENFQTINFSNVIIDKEGDGLSNNFITIIDDRYRIYNHHVGFSKNDLIPRYEENNVFYQKPWEYIMNKYESRLKRMKDKIDVVALYWPEAPIDYIHNLINVCKKKNVKCLIITNKIQSDDYAKIIHFYTKQKDKWNIPLELEYGEEIKNFLQEVK